MSTPTPTPITDTPLNNLFSFISNSSNQIQLLIIGGLVVTLFIIILYIKNKRE
jgi:hypothetical protein